MCSSAFFKQDNSRDVPREYHKSKYNVTVSFLVVLSNVTRVIWRKQMVFYLWSRKRNLVETKDKKWVMSQKWWYKFKSPVYNLLKSMYKIMFLYIRIPIRFWKKTTVAILNRPNVASSEKWSNKPIECEKRRSTGNLSRVLICNSVSDFV